MRKSFKWIFAIFVIASVFCGVGCKKEKKIDTMPPAEVSDFFVFEEKGIVELEWMNPEDKDFAGVEISMIPAEGALSSPMTFSKDVNFYSVYDLRFGETYTFTIRTFDNTKNFSSGITNSITIGKESEKEDDENSEEIVDENYKYKKSLWGKWTRIDTGEVYVISGNEFKRQDSWYDENLSDELVPESENILRMGTGESAPRLFRKAGGLTSFTAKVAGFSETVGRAANGTSEIKGKKGVKVKRQSKDIATDEDTVTSSEDGLVEFEDVVAGETQTITVETENGNVVTLDVTPTYEGENVGTIPIVESGYSFKTTYSVGSSAYWWEDNQDSYYFGNDFKEYTLRLTFTNIGDETCSTAQYELLTSDKELKLSNYKGGIASIPAGSSETAEITVSYGKLDSYYKDVTIAIQIVDTKLNKKWLDSITLRFYQTPIHLNFYAIKANSNSMSSGQLNGFIICPDGRSEYFNVLNDNYRNKVVPYNKNGNNDYTVVFSATETYSEMAYSFAVNHALRNDRVDFQNDILSTDKFSEFISSYETNNSEDTATVVESPLEQTLSYVQYGEIDYFKMNLDDCLYPRIDEIIIPPAGVSASGKTVKATIKGRNFLSPIENVQITCDSSYAISNLNKEIVDDNTISFDLKIPSNSGEFTVTAKSEFNEKSAKFVVSEYDVQTGDYVLKNGTYVKKSYYSELTDVEKANIFGVISVSETGVPVIVGIKSNEEGLCWATSDTTGYNTYFEGIKVAVSGGNWNNGVYDNYEFAGDLDGSDNWEYICSVDPEGTKNAEKNYPAFNYANNYSALVGLTGTKFEDGWYIPSIKELNDVLNNKYDLELDYFSRDGYFLSSSQGYDYFGYVCVMGFFDLHVGSYYSKDSSAYVPVIHTFNPKEFTAYNYGKPVISEVTIPTVGEGYTGELPVTIVGENLKAYEVTCDDSTFDNVQYVSDKKVTATIKSNGSVGDYSITVNCGTASRSGTYKVLAAEKCFNVGDILFTDGTRIKAEQAKYGVPDEKITQAFAIIGSVSYGGVTGVGVGVKAENNWWASYNSTGYNTNFEGIKVECSWEGDSYTFTGDLDGSDNWEYICSVDPEGTKNAEKNYPAFYYANTYGTTAGLTGTDYENGWYVPSVKELYDVYTNKDVIQTSLDAASGFTFGTRSYWSSSQYSSYDWYAYRVYFGDGSVYTDDKSYNYEVCVLHSFSPEQFSTYNYGVPSITSVEIQTAGEGYTGELPVTIVGENLKGYAITSSDTTITNVQYVSDKKVTATIKSNGSVGDYSITVNCGTASGSGTLKVLETEKCFSVGDVLFTDGTRIKAEQAKYGVPDEKISQAFAVIGSTPYGGGTGLAVGLKQSSDLQWAPSGSSSTGYNTNFEGIEVETYSSWEGDSYSYTFTGDLDGSDNWEYICSVDPEGTKNAEKNYPAFYYANTYGTTAGLTGTDYENGWYVPSVKELYDVYTNKDVIQTSLDAASGFTFGTRSYWSSSQYGSYNRYAYRMYFGDCTVSGDEKSYNCEVCVLHSFSPEQFSTYNYGVPSITSMEIQTAGEEYTGELPVTIIGENLKGYAITSSDTTITNVQYVSDKKATATIKCNGVVGDYSITINCGTASRTETLKVLDENKCFTSADIGKILLNNGTLVTVDAFNSESMIAIGVVSGLKYNGGQCFVIGLQKSYLQWACYDTVGYNTSFEKNKVEYFGSSEAGYEFTGDVDGSDNWEYICSVDPEGTKNAETNYPIFHYAKTYGVTAGLEGTEYENGWYVPSVAELYDVYTNKATIQTSMDKVGGFDIRSGWYWSSSQAFYIDYAYAVSFNYDTVNDDHKNSHYDVLVLQALNAE